MFTLRVTEVFKSCQGEGPGTGQPTVFVRFAGCNLALSGKPCSWCDTSRSQCNDGVEYTTSRLLGKVEELSNGCREVCLTGGEPLVQDFVTLRELVVWLRKRGYVVEVFTNGTIVPPLRLFQEVSRWVVDIKCPSSGVYKEGRIEDWARFIRPQDVMKFVVVDDNDLKHAQIVLNAYQPKSIVSFSPCIVGNSLLVLDPLNVRWLQRVWEFCTYYNYRFSLQVHKVVYGNKEGV